MEKKIPKVMADLFEALKEQWKEEPDLLEVFKTCYTNTLDTTVKDMGDGTTHVITGDIPAMWLRDSAAQLRPYIFLAKEDRVCFPVRGRISERDRKDPEGLPHRAGS